MTWNTRERGRGGPAGHWQEPRSRVPGRRWGKGAGGCYVGLANRLVSTPVPPTWEWVSSHMQGAGDQDTLLQGPDIQVDSKKQTGPLATKVLSSQTKREFPKYQRLCMFTADCIRHGSLAKVCCSRNSLQVIHPVTVGRCNPRAVTPTKISLHVGHVCSHFVPFHKEEVHREEGRSGPCAALVTICSVFTVPSVPWEPRLGRESSPESCGLGLGSGTESSQSPVSSVLPIRPPRCFEPGLALTSKTHAEVNSAHIQPLLWLVFPGACSQGILFVLFPSGLSSLLCTSVKSLFFPRGGSTFSSGNSRGNEV
ncbi:uncharacterized protein LOC105874140 [Microcebus murinus]|uniref:uncharacterized protein LOC105874140 n=1 Tax=Microcebus murinus TaxID=30608 RepID=UPI003F6B4394